MRHLHQGFQVRGCAGALVFSSSRDHPSSFKSSDLWLTMASLKAVYMPLATEPDDPSPQLNGVNNKQQSHRRLWPYIATILLLTSVVIIETFWLYPLRWQIHPLEVLSSSKYWHLRLADYERSYSYADRCVRWSAAASTQT